MAKKQSTLTRAFTRARHKLDRRPVAQFLHIGKTGGTAVKVALRQAEREQSPEYRVVVRKHEIRLPAIPEHDYVFFCLRDPIERYLSGFLSRQREGLPRYHIPWSEGEAVAFGRFESPDLLGVALGAGGTEQEQAETAMRAIRHVRSSFWDWFKDPDYFTRRADHIVWVGHQESLDIGPLAEVLGYEHLELPDDPRRANKSQDAKPALSELAQHNLRQWYDADYQFLDLCDEVLPRWSRSTPH